MSQLTNKGLPASKTYTACYIVPPIFLEEIIRHGTPEDRDSALRTLSVDTSLRSVRIQNSLVALPVGITHEVGGAPKRTIYDAGHVENHDASTMLRREGDKPAADDAANQAYDGLGDTYKFYWDIFKRNSIDDSGLPLDGEVHFGQAYNNAMWDGQRMVFGDGDQRIFTGFTKAIDVIGHELTHGVTQDTLGLKYLGQSGALNESISDVFGSMVKQYSLGQTVDKADWMIGSGILGPAMQGQALRSMKAPGTAFTGDNQPGSMKDYVNTARDNGGVHTNSGIPNRAFYLTAEALGGHSWEKAGPIWYQTMQDKTLKPTTQFRAFAQATVRAAASLYGAASAEKSAVQTAWSTVGVL